MVRTLSPLESQMPVREPSCISCVLHLSKGQYDETRVEGEGRTISPSQTLVSHHRPQGLVSRRLRVIISRFMKNMLDRFVIGDPEHVFLRGRQVYRAASVGETAVPLVQLLRGQRRHIADGTLLRLFRNLKEVTLCYVLVCHVSGYSRS